MGLNNIFSRHKIKNVETFDSISRSYNFLQFNAKIKFIRMAFISANRLYLFLCAIAFFSSRKSLDRSRRLLLSMENMSIRIATMMPMTTTTTMTWVREPPGFRRGMGSGFSHRRDASLRLRAAFAFPADKNEPPRAKKVVM